MSRTFTKLFSSITESTVWCEPDGTRLVWICMLAMADRNGRVWGSVPGLANRARVQVDATRKAIETFLAPDPDSRTADFEGRRIEAIDGGWRLLNHEKYRAIRDEESTLEAKRKYINARRAAEREAKDVDASRSTVDHGRDNAEAEAEAIIKVKTSSGPALRAAPAPPPPFDGNNAEALNGKAIVPIAATFDLPELWGVDAEALGWQRREVLYQAEKFRQYWTAGKGQGKRRSVKGWRQSWSTWLDRAAKDQR